MFPRKGSQKNLVAWETNGAANDGERPTTCQESAKRTPLRERGGGGGGGGGGGERKGHEAKPEKAAMPEENRSAKLRAQRHAKPHGGKGTNRKRSAVAEDRAKVKSNSVSIRRKRCRRCREANTLHQKGALSLKKNTVETGGEKNAIVI